MFKNKKEAAIALSYWFAGNSYKLSRYLELHHNDFICAANALSLSSFLSLYHVRDHDEAQKRFLSFDLEKHLLYLAQHEIAVLCFDDLQYPKELLHSHKGAPIVLYVCGDISVRGRCVSVVGTRSYVEHPLELQMVADIARQGFCIVSGMAYGVDRMAHDVALQNGAMTLAVLGSGHACADMQYVQRILLSGGIVMSEYPPFMPAARYTFPARNRLIAALGDALLVVSAPEKSGALLTVDDALSVGKSLVFGVPGSLNDLNKRGIYKYVNLQHMQLAVTAKDVLSALEVSDFGEAVCVIDDPFEFRVASALQRAMTCEELSVVLGCDYSKVMSCILLLHLRGVVEQKNALWVCEKVLKKSFLQKL